MITPWGASLDPENVLPEYPRPQLVRDSYLNLNGHWEYAFTPAGAPVPSVWDGRILVPFSPEAPLSGVGRRLEPDEALWYRRRIGLPEGFVRDRVLLHFGAVDQDARVWVDGVVVGEHRGGYLPFTVDITDALAGGADSEHSGAHSGALGEGEHEIVVAVRDVTDTSWRSRGKQAVEPGGIWYTAQSGIWQTVWLESVPAAYVHRLDLTPHLDTGEVEVLVHSDAAHRAEVVVTADDVEVARAVVTAGVPSRLALSEVRTWSPADPFLHDVQVRMGEDRVSAYLGMRSVALGADESGRTRLLLNGEPFLHAGLLDQGYWPDGLYTPPSDEALVFDIQTAKDLGFTMLRKHIKIEPLRWYHYCDRLGMLVWQDVVSGGTSYGRVATQGPVVAPWLRLGDAPSKRFGRADLEGREEFLRELEDTVDLLRSAPSVVVWVPFNEGWGQFEANRVAAWLASYDPTRPVDHASGWFDQGGGDCRSLHVYFKALPRVRPKADRAVVLSEFGGYSMRVAGHVWNESAEFGYSKYGDRDALTGAYVALLEQQLVPWIEAGLSAAIYTQTTDVEIEINGYVTYDREVVKMDPVRVRAAHRQILERTEAPHEIP